MAVTLTVNTDHTASLSSRYLARQGEVGALMTVTVPSAVYALGTYAYIDFTDADGVASYLGDYDASSGTFVVSVGAADNILAKDGIVKIQFVLRDNLISESYTAVWKSQIVEAIVERSVNADTYAIPAAMPSDDPPATYEASRVSIEDVGTYYASNNVEDALQEAAGDIAQNTADISNGYRYMQSLYYTSNGVLEKASYSWLRAIRVRLVGGGGAGGGASATTAGQASCGAGGGGGGYAEIFILASALSASEIVTVGIGGTSVVGADGNDGTNSSFGSHCIGEAGRGGTYNTSSAGNLGVGGGAGGGGTGDFVINGQNGENRFVSGGMAYRGYGGDSTLGMASRIGFKQSTSTYSLNSGGTSGTGYGCGGSGAINGESQATAVSGGSGRDGIVIVDLYA